MKTRNDCEIACDCVKLANVVLHAGLCKEIFARKHTATHKPTSAHHQSAHMTTMTHIHIHTHTHTHTSNKIANRSGAPRPPLTDAYVVTETAFRLDQRKHFRKSKHLLRSEVSWCDLHLPLSTWHCTRASKPKPTSTYLKTTGPGQPKLTLSTPPNYELLIYITSFCFLLFPPSPLHCP